MFSTSESAHGCGHAVRSINKGVRTTSVDYLDMGEGKHNIEIITNKYVDKVLLEMHESQTLQASEVEVQGTNGEVSTFKARKEIILTAGAYGSPAILLRSGIGPRRELDQLNIEIVLDYQGVGKNLMDHMVCLTPNTKL